MIYLAVAVLSLAVIVHIQLTHRRHELLRRKVLRLQKDVATLAVAGQNREAAQVSPGRAFPTISGYENPLPDDPCPGVNCGGHT